MEEELADLREQCIKSIHKSADYVMKYLDDEEDKNNEIQKLKTYVQSYCYLDQLPNSDKLIHFIKQQSEEICNYEDFEAQLSKLSKKLTYTKHTYMKSFMDKTKSDRSSLPLSQDSEIEITQADTTSILDPITKQPIKMPVKNKFCGHVYDMISISEYIRTKSKARCPYVGCPNTSPINTKSLIPIDLAKEHSGIEQMESQDYDYSSSNSD